MHSYVETKNDSICDSSCTLRRFRFGTYTIYTIQATWFLLDWVYMASASGLMLYEVMNSGDFKIYTKHIHAMCGKNMRFLMLNNEGTNSYHWALKR